MNEDFFDSFWISDEKPDGLPDNWLWLVSIFDLDSIVFTYELLYPEGSGIKGRKHYVCMDVADYDELSWVNLTNYESFTFIWRSSNKEQEEFENDEEDY